MSWKNVKLSRAELADLNQCQGELLIEVPG
jgi:hypothetical protein